MKVLLFTNALKLGGSELVALLEADGLIKHDIEAKMIAAKGSRNQALEERYSIKDRISYCNFPQLRPKNFKKILLKLEGLVDEVNKFAPDIIHSHGELPDLFTLYLKLRLKKYSYVKYIRTSHNERYLSLRYGFILERFVNLFFNHTIAISQRTKKLNGINNCSVIFNPVRLNTTPKIKAQPVKITNFGIIGRLSSQKKQVQFLREFAKHVGPNWNGTIKLYGFEESEFPMLEVPKYFWKNIQILGFVSDIDRLYDDVDAIIIPSIYEGMSTVMIEALSRGKLVFSTKVSGVEDLEHITNKLKVFTDSMDLKNKIDTVTPCESQIESNLWHNMFHPSVHIAALLKVYEAS